MEPFEKTMSSRSRFLGPQSRYSAFRFKVRKNSINGARILACNRRTDRYGACSEHFVANAPNTAPDTNLDIYVAQYRLSVITRGNWFCGPTGPCRDVCATRSTLRRLSLREAGTESI